MAIEVSEDVKTEDEPPKIEHNLSERNWLNFSQKRSGTYPLIITLIVMTAILIILLIVYLSTSTTTQFSYQNYNNISGKKNQTLSQKFKLVSRLEWLAEPPIQPANNLAVPVPYVIIHHTSTENCSSQAQCTLHVRYLQTFHIKSRNWWDIGYNFLVGGDGKVYEGRGWISEGAHTYGYNAKSIGIAFIGTFNSYKPPERQLTACKLLIQEGVELGYIKNDYQLLASRQLLTTKSPGDALYEELTTWDHWAIGP